MIATSFFIKKLLIVKFSCFRFHHHSVRRFNRRFLCISGVDHSVGAGDDGGRMQWVELAPLFQRQSIKKNRFMRLFNNLNAFFRKIKISFCLKITKKKSRLPRNNNTNSHVTRKISTTFWTMKKENKEFWGSRRKKAVKGKTWPN